MRKNRINQLIDTKRQFQAIITLSSVVFIGFCSGIIFANLAEDLDEY
jgi:hypothetical protein